MDDADILMKEYAKTYGKFIYGPLKYTGFCRFDIINNQIVKLTYKTMIYNTLILLIADCAVGYLLYSSVALGNYLKIPDALCVIYFALYVNVIVINLTFLNTRSALVFVEQNIIIDSYLGIKETAITREVAIKTFLALSCLIFVTNIGTGIFLYQIYKVPMTIHVVGSLYFFWLYFSYNDYAFAMMLFTQTCMRIRYLNVALMKIGEMDENYVPSRSVFDLLFWNKKLNNTITFHHNCGVEEFNKAYRMCFKMLALLENYYAFPFFYGICTVVVGSFVAVQTFIMRVKNPTLVRLHTQRLQIIDDEIPQAMDNEHTYIIVGWVILTWNFILVVTLITDMIPHQLHQTKLICSYIQMKPNKSAKIYKLTKTVLGTVRMRRHMPNIYNLFNFGAAFVLKIAASTLVYITVQLQLAFPRIPLNNVNLNETNILVV